MCAIIGIAGHEEASNFTYLGLHALQHRGQEGAGIVSTEEGRPFEHRRQGLVSEVFEPEDLKQLRGRAAIGHTRYSTTGGNTHANLQPMLMKSGLGWISLAHNGNIVNAGNLTTALESQGAIFQSTNDTEVLFHLMARAGSTDFVECLTRALKQVEGAYSLVALNKDTLVAVRDPHGFRPLVMGEVGGAVVFASETCAFTLMGAKYTREVEPGEMVVVPLKSSAESRSHFPFEAKPIRRCIFEHIYLARPDSVLYGNNVHNMRKALGRRLAIEQPTPTADLVIPVPDSGVAAAIGYAEAAQLPFDMGIIRSHYVGRTFIEPRQAIRDFGVKLKLTAVEECVAGKKLVVVDDSLVRGTTSRKLVKHLREAGAREVHLRIAAPPTAHSCFYGVDTPTRSELVASSHSVSGIRDFVGADSLGYLTLEGLHRVVQNESRSGYCDACFSGNYPTAV